MGEKANLDSIQRAGIWVKRVFILPIHERRIRQSEKIRRWKPWEKSTGRIIPEGKRKISHNAYKGGIRELLRALKVRMKSI